MFKIGDIEIENKVTIAPMAAPYIDPVPPIISTINKRSDVSMEKSSIPMNSLVIPNNPPAMPA